MMRQAPGGENWRNAVGEFETNVSSALDTRYGKALDLLARKVAPHLLDCDGGVWIPRGGDSARHKLSLAWLGHQIVTECERARLAPRPSGVLTKSRPSTAARSRKTFVKDLRSVASALKTSPDISLKAIRSAREFVISSPTSVASRYSAVPLQMQTFLKSQAALSRSDLADALRAISDELENLDRRSTRGGSELPETTLATILVTQLRVATGAAWSYQNGDLIPRGGKPFYDIVTAFVEAAGWTMDLQTIKDRIEAKRRA